MTLTIDRFHNRNCIMDRCADGTYRSDLKCTTCNPCQKLCTKCDVTATNCQECVEGACLYEGTCVDPKVYKCAEPNFKWWLPKCFECRPKCDSGYWPNTDTREC